MSTQREFYKEITLTNDGAVETTVKTGTGVNNIKNQEEFFRLVSVTNNKLNIKVV